MPYKHSLNKIIIKAKISIYYVSLGRGMKNVFGYPTPIGNPGRASDLRNPADEDGGGGHSPS